MANSNSLFLTYNGIIRLSDAKRSQLIGVRDILRRRMKEGYVVVSKEFTHKHNLDFQTQGSFVMDTIIKPVHDDYDLDDGVYFFGKLSEKDRPSPQSFHDWVRMSIDRGHSDIEKIVDKATCVRVYYKEGFHVDIPIYYADNIDAPDLADKEQGWTLSHPVEFIAWFEEKIQSGFQKAFLYESRMMPEYERWTNDIRKQDHQLRRIVRYLKSWGDLRREEMPCGLIMTILAANHYYPHDRDDISLKETLVKIHAQLAKNFECKRPTTPVGEDLLRGYKHKEKFLIYLDAFIQNGKKALEESNNKEACEHWQKSLGDRFPCHLAKDESTFNTTTAGLASGASSSRPWANI